MRPDVAPAQAVKTLIHELGQALLHSEELPRSKEVAEVEVESVAFVVCDAIGLDTGNYSFPYVARWAGGSEDLIRQTGGRVIDCAKSILGCLVAASEDDEEMENASRTSPPSRELPEGGFRGGRC